MKNIRNFLVFGAVLSCLTISSGCNERSRSYSSPVISVDSTVNDSVTSLPITYNFYVENSGSVKGYFKENDNTASVVLKEFYDRIDEMKSDNDTLTLNYINNALITQKTSINNFISNIYSNCNAQYSDLDKIFESILDKTNERTVNLVLSDYCFESQTGSLPLAQSEITKIFTRAKKKNKSLSIAIFKYDASFSGKYFPGAINYTGNRPIYLWAFGASKEIKQIVKLPVKQIKEAQLFLQPFESIVPIVKTNYARMTNKEKNEINVSEWKRDRFDADLYKVELSVNLKNLVLPSSSITDCNKYSCFPREYSIEQISEIGNDTYIFKINTTNPSPCQLKIAYSIDNPSWVEASNFEGHGLPQNHSTYGIKYLIGGVIDAYQNGNKNVFEINLSLK